MHLCFVVGEVFFGVDVCLKQIGQAELNAIIKINVFKNIICFIKQQFYSGCLSASLKLVIARWIPSSSLLRRSSFSASGVTGGSD